jgi:uncharacterized membrane protein YhdT
VEARWDQRISICYVHWCIAGGRSSRSRKFSHTPCCFVG